MAINKVDIKFNNQIMDRENIEKLAKAVNDNADVVDTILDGNLIETDLKVKTIAQTDYNWDSGNLTLNNDWLNGLTAINSFVKFVIVNNIMYIVVSTKLKNNTENSITTAINKSLISAITIPEEYADKIYRKDGTNLSQDYGGSDDSVIGVTYRLSTYTGAYKALIEGNVYSAGIRQLGLWATSSTATIPAGEERILDFRTFIVL